MRRKGKWTRIHREDMNPYMFDGVRCEACKMCFGLPTPYCPNCGAKMQDNEDFEVGILAEVVRCKDCKHWEVCDEEDGISYGQCMNPLWVISNTVFLNEDWYCADGERKEDGD